MSKRPDPRPKRFTEQNTRETSLPKHEEKTPINVSATTRSKLKQKIGGQLITAMGNGDFSGGNPHVVLADDMKVQVV